MAPNGNFSHDAMVHGIAELVQGATKIDSDAAGPDTGAGRNVDEAEDDTKVDDEEQVTKEDENIAAPAQVQAQMDTGLLNEFQQNDFIIGGSFPMEFPLGVPDTYAVGHLPAHVSRRLLQSYLPQFERCTEFIFYAFNQLVRHAASRAVAYRAKAGDKYLLRFQELVDDPGFDAMLQAAEADPAGPEAHKLLRVLMPLVSSTSKKVPWSPGERASELPRLYGQAHRYGLTSDFITFSQYDPNEPLVIKIGSRRINEAGKWEMPDGRTIWNSNTAAARKQIAMFAPATCAANFHCICRAVLEGLFGIGLDRKKEMIRLGQCGILGVVRSASAVIEAQARGSLHLHILLWLLHGPIFFARFVHDPAAQQVLRDFIDGTVTACLSSAQHAQRRLPVRGMRPYPSEHMDLPMAASAPVRITRAALAARGAECAGSVNYHDHRSRCRKGAIGKIKCSQAKPRPLSVTTVWDQVKLVPTYDDLDQLLPKKAWDAGALPRIAPAPETCPPDGQPLPEPDNRVICLTLKRPSPADQMMVEFHALMSGFLGCNTANLKTGTAQDAKAALYYQVKYLSKNPCELVESLTLLLAAQKIVACHGGSVADDAGSPERQAKYLLSKVLNKITGLQEYSVEQCAAGLQGFKSSFNTEIETYMSIRIAMKAVKAMAADDADDEEDDSSGSESGRRNSDDDDDGNGDMMFLGREVGATPPEAQGAVELHCDDAGVVHHVNYHDDFG